MILLAAVLWASNVDVARAALAKGDLLEATLAVQAGLAESPKDHTLAELGAALLRDVDPARAGALRAALGPPAAPLPVVGPAAPVQGAGEAFVNVASATVRAAPKESARAVKSLAIGSRVEVGRVENGFAAVAGGWIRSDLLSSQAPTVESLQREAAAAGDADRKLSLLWRALHLDARDAVLESAVAAAFEARRPTIAVAAAELAVSRGAPAAARPSASSHDELRRALYRAVVARHAAPFLETVRLSSWRDPAAPDLTAGIPLLEAWETVLGDPKNVAWIGLQRALLSPVNESQPVMRSFEAGGYFIGMVPQEGVWRVSSLSLGEGAAACVVADATLRGGASAKKEAVGYARRGTPVGRLLSRAGWTLVRVGRYDHAFGWLRDTEIAATCPPDPDPAPRAAAGPIHLATCSSLDGAILVARWTPGGRLEPLLPHKASARELQSFALAPWSSVGADDIGRTPFPRPRSIPAWANGDAGGGRAPAHVRLGPGCFGEAGLLATAPVRALEPETISESGTPTDAATGPYSRVEKVKGRALHLHLREAGGKRCWGWSMRADATGDETCAEETADKEGPIPPGHPEDRWFELDAGGTSFFLRLRPFSEPADNGGTSDYLELMLVDANGNELESIQMHVKTQWGC